jgi:hypothetical protein
LLLDLRSAEASHPKVSLAPEPSVPSANGHSLPTSSNEIGITQRDVNANQSLQRGIASTAEPQGERLSPREELVNLVDEWMAAADDEQEKKALLATKEELLAALDKIKR